MMREPRTFVYRRVGQCEIKADVYSAGDGTRPVIFWIHGGALIMGWRGNLNPRLRDDCLRAGHHFVSIDYRLAPETKLPAIAEDLRDAHRWVCEEGPRLFGADPDRIAVAGGSAGGYLTLLAGCLLRPRPRALVSFYGYGDIVGDWYSRPDPYYCTLPAVLAEEAYAAVGHGVLCEDRVGRDRGRFYLYCRQQGLWPREVVGREPTTEPEAFDAWCPVRHVEAAYPPTLLLHGDQDTDVPYAQSVMMAEALSRAGVKHELITMPGGGHGFDGEENEATARALARVMGFLGEALR